MTPGLRFLSWLAHAVVLVWLSAYLAWTGLQSRAELEDAPTRSRVEILPQAAAAAAEPPPPETGQRGPAAEFELREVGWGEIAEGAGLLQGGATFPALSAGYAAFRSFDNYARAMTSLGARFVVIRGREIVGATDLATGEIRALESLGRFSPRARDYAGEPALGRLSRSLREHYGETAVLRMLVPRDLDAGLYGGIARALSERGDSHESYREIRGHYEPTSGGGTRLRIDSGVRMDGERVSLALSFDLGQIMNRAASLRDPSA